MTKKLQRMTPNPTSNPTFSNPTSIVAKTSPKNHKKIPPIFGRIVEGRIEFGIEPCQEKKKINTPPRTALPVFYLHSILHGTVSPLPPYKSCSSASTTAPCLLPAIVVLCLCRRSFVDCCFFVLVLCMSSVAVFLQTVAPPTQPSCPASCQPSLLYAFAAAHLLIVVFCHCCQHHCSLSATGRPPCLFSHRCPPPHLPPSSTSSYCRP
jgi:hypothetical protein